MSRVTTILETVAAERHGVTLSVVAGALDAPKSSVHALLGGLVATGYLREQGGVYFLGPAVTALLVPPRVSLRELARPGMKRLHARFDETVMLGSLVGRSVVYVEAIESTQLIRYSPPLRRRRPIYPTSSGKSFLAHMQPGPREQRLRELFPDVHRRAEVTAELQRARDEGVAYNRGETLADTTAVSSAVLSGERIAGCLVIAGPTPRMVEVLDAAADAVREAALAMSREMDG